MAQGEPPARVGRLAFTNGTVSFHDDEQSGWTPAVVNTPLTTGDGIWTEPNARSEISLAGTRIRMEGATQLDMLALDDTPDPPAARAGPHRREVLRDGRQPALRDRHAARHHQAAAAGRLLRRGGLDRGSDAARRALRRRPDPGPEWPGARGTRQRSRRGDGRWRRARSFAPSRPRRRRRPPIGQAATARSSTIAPQYLSAGVTGYEDLNAYGDWINDGGYGRVWVPRSVPSGWAPYRTGHWAYVQPWGWTWIDEQPWGFAPYHYGRWANRGNRWVWVPPQRDVRPVYAPALVAFVGGTELAVTLGNQSAAPVGWFPLGPREVYVPSYTTDRDYYRRLNRSARIEDRILEDRWQRAQRREAFTASREQAMMNQRFATVVPTSAFVRSQPVMRSALQVQPQAIAAAPVAPVAAPPAPTASVVSATAAPSAATPQPKAATAPAPQQQAAPADPKVEAEIEDGQRAGRQDGDRRHADPGQAGGDGEVGRAGAEARRDPAQGRHRRQGETGRADARASSGCGAAGTEGRHHACTRAARQAGRAAEAAAGRASAASSTAAGRAQPNKQQATPAPGPQQAKPGEPPKPQAAPPLPQPQQAKPAEPPKPQAAPPAPAPQQARPAEPPSRPAARASAPASAGEAGAAQAAAAGRAAGASAAGPAATGRPRCRATPAAGRSAAAAPGAAASAAGRTATARAAAATGSAAAARNQQAAPPQPAPQQRQQAAPQPQPQPKPPEQAQSRPAPQPDNRRTTRSS